MASLYLIHASGHAQQIAALASARSFLSSSPPPPKPCPDFACFRDDESPPPVDRSLPDNPLLSVRYSPWSVNGYGKPPGADHPRDPTGGSGGGKRGDNDDGDGGGDGGGDEDGEEAPFLLSLLTIALASFHLGYCAAVWMKDEVLSFNFVSTAVALFSLLSVAAIRLNERTGIDAYILGLGASVGVTVWTGITPAHTSATITSYFQGQTQVELLRDTISELRLPLELSSLSTGSFTRERCLARREGSPAGIVALFSTFMAVLFSTALFNDL